jgi:hypothetical protein
MKLDKNRQNILRHEIAFRGEATLEKRAKSLIVVCGAGALGSNLINSLLRQHFPNIRVIDNDKVESHNIANQIYGKADVGAAKARACANRMFRDLGYKIEAVHKELIHGNAKKLLKGAALVLDTFDNFESRGTVKEACGKLSLPCIHVGMSDDGFSEVKWNEVYRIPEVEVEQEDICEYPLALNLVWTTVCMAAEAVVAFIDQGKKLNLEFTLGDLAISSL